MEVSVIIVNYNTTSLTEQCIASVLAHTKNDFEIIVVDNASPDRSIENITIKFPEVQLLQNQSNLGFGTANNHAIRIARGEFIFLLNSDTVLRSDAIGTFINYMRQPGNAQVAVCGGELSTGTEKETPSFGNFPSLFQCISSLGFFYLYPSYYRKHLDIGVTNYDDEIKQVDFISGADMMIRASVLQETGLFDEDFFLYFEETELSYRIKKRGYRSVLLPEVKITHFEGSSSRPADPDNAVVFNYIGYRNYAVGRQLFYKKVHGSFFAAIAKSLHIFHAVLKWIAGKEEGSLVRKLRIIIQS
jgi:GT2 family glycosyltransferase